MSFKGVTLVLALLLSQAALGNTPSANTADTAAYRQWISDMKAAARGPFERIRWFCNDGTVLPPRAYACNDHGGGHQHGEWNQHTQTLRSQGYLIANVLAGLDPEALLAAPGARDALAQILVERYLVAVDDGWIFRKAQFYRGAVQEEDERNSARALLMALVADEHWLATRYAMVYSAARLLPHGATSASVQEVRQVSAGLSDRDANFAPLRAKIHGAPSADDALRVREYAAALPQSAQQPYLDLADAIDAIYQAAPLNAELRTQADQYTAAPWLQEMLRNAADDYVTNTTPAERLRSTGKLIAQLRDALPRVRASSVRLALVDLSLQVEAVHFNAATQLRPTLSRASRAERLAYLHSAGLAAYGTGALNRRLTQALESSLKTLSDTSVALPSYRDAIGYLSRAPGWGTQQMRMQFYESMRKLSDIEPRAMLFIQDQLRGSPLLFYSQVLDGLGRDASQLAGVQHRLFGKTIGSGFTALNPGLATGILHTRPNLGKLEEFRSDGIYLLPETVSGLPPVAGILTEGEGNPLSHVQLLARNLGIPNLTVTADLVKDLAAHDGQRIVLAVSPSGQVEMERWSSRWESIFADQAANKGVEINPDLEKLDLSVREFISLDKLRADDSGRTVGPKAAKLGELRAHFPRQVSRGVAIPFGMFRQEALERPHPRAEGTVFDWMVAQYRQLESLPAGSVEHEQFSRSFRRELYGIISSTQPSDEFRTALRAALADAFGTAPGVFVRSDTNVEDLAGFTGAGLNLTLPNVVGFDALLDGIVEVWASPFTARAFAWRQSHMSQPEHVYTSILLLESVASDKSGVMVTQDIDTGESGVLSVAINEGLGGAVDGQAAESLRIPLDGSDVRVLATATAPWRRVPDPAGGLQYLPSTGSDSVLQPSEIQQLITFAKELPREFPPITDDEGNPAPADIEFGFLNDDLRLFQLRPFLESKQARGTTYLQTMEAAGQQNPDVRVDMQGVPNAD